MDSSECDLNHHDRFIPSFSDSRCRFFLLVIDFLPSMHWAHFTSLRNRYESNPSQKTVLSRLFYFIFLVKVISVLKMQLSAGPVLPPPHRWPLIRDFSTPGASPEFYFSGRPTSSRAWNPAASTSGGVSRSAPPHGSSLVPPLLRSYDLIFILEKMHKYLFLTIYFLVSHGVLLIAVYSVLGCC